MGIDDLMMENKHYRQSMCKSTYRKGEGVAPPKINC